jgi:hypothetical protein
MPLFEAAGSFAVSRATDDREGELGETGDALNDVACALRLGAPLGN